MASKNNITPEAIEEIEKDGKEGTQVIVQKNKFDEKNYLNMRLDLEKGEVTREVKIRILPISSDDSSPFKKIHMHYAKVNKKISEKGFKNYICLEKTEGIDTEQFGSKCPFCEAKKAAWKKYQDATDEAEKNEWLKVFKENCSDEYAIVRCIERGHESDGPKFWKFRVRTDEKDAMHTILKLYRTRRDESIEEEYGAEFLSKSKDEQEAQFEADGFTPLNILDIYDGRDLKLTISAVRDKMGKLTDKTTVDITDYGKIKPISDNDELIEAWINDGKKWSDVFTVKPYDYLQILSEGKIPYFSKKDNKWVEWDENYKKENDSTTEPVDTEDVPF